MIRAAVSFAVVLLLIPAAVVGTTTRRSDAQPALTADHLGGIRDICGQLLEYVAPTAGTDGSLLVTGVAAEDPHPFTIAAGTVIAPATDAALTALAGSDSFTCLEIEGDGMGFVVSLALAAEATVCGSVDVTTGGAYVLIDTVNDVTVTLSAEASALVAADATLSALLEAAAGAAVEGVDLCLTLMLDGSGELTALSLDGSLDYCGSVGDTSAQPSTAVFEYVNDLPVPAPTVIIGPVEYDSALFSEAALAVIEIAYWVETETVFSDGFQTVCLAVEIVASSSTSVVVQANAGICGDPDRGALVALIAANPQPNPAFQVLIHDAVLGFEFAAYTSADQPNLGQLFRIEPAPEGRLCIQALFDGGVADTTANGWGAVNLCAIVDEITATTVTLLAADGFSQADFRLTPGSTVDPALTVGELAAISITANSGVEGAVNINETSIITCQGAGEPTPSGGGGALPDTGNEARLQDHRGSIAGLLLIAVTMLITRLATGYRRRP